MSLTCLVKHCPPAGENVAVEYVRHPDATQVSTLTRTGVATCGPVVRNRRLLEFNTVSSSVCVKDDVVMAVLNATRQSPVHGAVGSQEELLQPTAAPEPQGPQGPPTPLRLWVLPACPSANRSLCDQRESSSSSPRLARKPAFPGEPGTGFRLGE